MFLRIQPISQKSRTPTVANLFQIGLHDPAEADLKQFWDSCSAGFLGERLFSVAFIEKSRTSTVQKSSTST